MNNFDVFPKNSLLFAPMEGITDEPYRLAMLKTFPEWDQFFTDFLRVPTVGKINEKMILYLRSGDHFDGERLKRLKEKKLKKIN